MASHSEHGRYVRGYAADRLIDKGPVDTGAMRDAVANNLRHLHDGHGQALAKLVRGAGEFWEQASPSTTLFKRVPDLVPIQIPLRVKASSGESFLVVTRLRASISLAGTATFRVVLSFAEESVTEPSATTESDQMIAEVSTTSTTAVELDPATLRIPSGQIAARVGAGQPAYLSLASKRGDGSVGTGTFLHAALTVWAKSSQGSSLPRVHAFEAREYVGA